MTTGLPTGYKQFSLVVPKPSTRVRKGKNLFDLAFAFKDFGVGTRFTRASWKYPEPCYWTLTTVRPTKNVRHHHHHTTTTPLRPPAPVPCPKPSKQIFRIFCISARWVRQDV